MKNSEEPMGFEAVATTYIEENAPGSKKGWRWQRHWEKTYCIVVENKVVKDHFKV